MTMSFSDLAARVAATQRRLEHTVATVTEEQARGASLLPGWSRGHVLSHIARNADGLNRLAGGVLAGTEVDMYPGGPAARAAAIEEGADRPVELLRGDVTFTGRRLIATLAQITEDQVETPVRWNKRITAYEIPVFRWREVEIHQVDLDLGYTIADWPSEFVRFNLERELADLPQRAPGVSVPVLRDHELLAWLVGRLSGEGLPELPPWP